MKKILLLCAAVFSVTTFALLFAPDARADKLAISAASDLKFAMDEIIGNFEKDHPLAKVSVTYGSSGKFNTQIQRGAPYDLYFSADISFPRNLHKNGFAASEVTPYALGRIVLWSTTLDASKLTLASLVDPKITRIAIANPKHAPYGKRAQEALRSAGMWDKVEHKIVYAESISHAAQFVQTKNAQVGIVALSLVLSPSLAKLGGYWLIPDNLHQPLEQGFIITKRAEKNLLARLFSDYMSSPDTRTVMTRYGFVIPENSKKESTPVESPSPSPSPSPSSPSSPQPPAQK